MSIKIDIDLREIYKRLCADCRKRVLQYIKEKMDEALIEQIILGSKKEEAGEK